MLMTPSYRNVTFDELVTNYYKPQKVWWKVARIFCLLKPCLTRSTAKPQFLPYRKFFSDTGKTLPVMISGTITDASGRTLSGQTAEAFWNSVRHGNLLSRLVLTVR
jgi:5-methyltetrahydrofolate--homocysteine methyltransferase